VQGRGCERDCRANGKEWLNLVLASAVTNSSVPHIAFLLMLSGASNEDGAVD